MVKKIEIASLDIDVERLIKNASKTAGAIQQLKEQQEQLRKKGEEASKQFVENAATLKNLEGIYKTQQATLSVQIAENEKLLSQKKNIRQAVEQQNNSENGYIQNNRQLLELKKQLRVSDDDYEKRLAKINEKISENNYWLRENGSANANLMTTMADFKTQITDSFDAINIFNGGISGFVTRAQEAGGVGKLFSKSLLDMGDGIKGMGVAFKANPLGFFLALLAPLIEKLMSMPAVTKAVEKAMSALGPVIEIVSKPLEWLANGIAWVIEGFANFVSSSTEAGRAAQKLEKDQEALKKKQEELKASQEELSAAMSVQEERNEKAKQDIDGLMKKVNDQTKSEKERLNALAAAHAIEKQNLAERKTLTEKAYNEAVNQAALGKGLTAQEIANLQAGGAAYAEKMMRVKSFTKEEIDALQKANLARMRISAEEKQIVQGNEDAKQKIADDAHAKREAAAAKAKQAQDARRQKADKARQDALTLQKLELDNFIESQGTKAKTMKEELAFAEAVHKKKLAIINAEFAASDKSAIAKQQQQNALLAAENEIAAQRAQVAVDNADKELKRYIEANATKLQNDEALSAESIETEKQRLQNLLTEQLKYEKTRLDNHIITQEQYDEAANKLTADKKAADQKLDDDYVKQEDDKKAAKAVEEYEKRRANATTEFEQQRIDEEQRHTTVLADLDKQLADGKITKEKYNELEKEETKKNAEETKRINKAAFDNKLDLANQTFGSLQAILGKESAAGKAMAIAQATIDTYKSATAAYSSMATIPFVGPALGAVAAAAAVAAGIQNVKKITSTKTPKAEKGALFNIGGQRHSAGGTLFTGADGTQFEAEQGELIGVMNRNAARHFMAFNNAFPAGGGSAPNYFASGGIVSREVAGQGLNVDELAAKIATANASLPAPVVAVQDIVSQGNSYVKVRDGANF